MSLAADERGEQRRVFLLMRGSEREKVCVHVCECMQGDRQQREQQQEIAIKQQGTRGDCSSLTLTHSRSLIRVDVDARSALNLHSAQSLALSEHESRVRSARWRSLRERERDKQQEWGSAPVSDRSKTKAAAVDE